MRVAGDMVPLASEALAVGQGIHNPHATIIEVVLVLLSCKVGITTEPRGAKVPPMVPLVVTKIQVPGSTPVGSLTSSAPSLRVLRVIAMISPNALVTVDAGLAERLLSFILQPRDHWKRSDQIPRDTIDGILPQLLVVSLLLLG